MKKTTENIKAMKTTILTIIILLTTITCSVTAGGLKRAARSEAPKTEIAVDLEKLAPATPEFAEFSDEDDLNALPEIPITGLAPVMPVEADFEDLPDTAGITVIQSAGCK
jgi:hypothetical protein